ncbi:winged helix-turn-helix domain-containing protein [Haloarchaeobius baliensis]|uniref:winged helix-turn-helix domain-containing protein n=1 Tax=Haloarchaeobius baliensis TaxID=1670458 RepID=UPI003F88165A
MTEGDADDDSLAAAVGAVDGHTTRAFSLLGDDTRLAILLALWEEYDPHADDNAVPFSVLFERVDYDNPGNFSYHLEQLAGQFIRQRGERGGYELRVPGLKLVQAVIAGAGVQDVVYEPTEISKDCPLCGASTTIHYEEGLLFHSCSDCEGPTPDRTSVDGFLHAVKFQPAGLADRTAEEIRAASIITSLRTAQSMFDGVCPTCSGAVESWLECCPDHEETGVCGNCGSEFAAWARFRCRVCKDHTNHSPKELALFHPAVVSFYDDHDVSTRFHASDYESLKRGFELLHAHEMALVSTDPPQVAVTAALEDDEVRLTFDESVRVVDVVRRS